MITKDVDDVARASTSASKRRRCPSTLRSVLQARLDALSEDERLALQRASVIGRVFWDDAVDYLRVDGDRCLDRPSDRPIATPSTGCEAGRSCTSGSARRSTHNREFLFKHALLRDVAYDGVLRRHRRPTTGWPPGGSSRWSSARAGPTSTPA